MSDYTKIIGKRLRAIRKNKGMTQELLGEKVQMQQPYLGEIERGLRNVSLDTLEKLCVALEVGLFELLSFTEIDIDNTNLEKKTIIELHNIFLSSRKIEEVKMIHKVSKEIVKTIDEIKS